MKQVRVILSTLLLSIAAVSFVQAQDYNNNNNYNNPQPKFGFKAGLNLSNFYSTKQDVGDENLKVGLNVGLFAKMPLNNAVAIQPEVLYSSQGSRVRYNNALLGQGEYRFNLNYVQVPVLLVFNLGQYFNIHAGPYASFLTSVNIKDLKNNGTVNDIATLNVDNYNRLDYGAAAGVAFETKGFTLGARYNLGLKEVGKSGTLAGQINNNSKNSFGTVYLGITF
jgi:hypothetical protein